MIAGEFWSAQPQKVCYFSDIVLGYLNDVQHLIYRSKCIFVEGQTPGSWESSVLSMIDNISDKVSLRGLPSMCRINTSMKTFGFTFIYGFYRVGSDEHDPSFYLRRSCAKCWCLWYSHRIKDIGKLSFRTEFYLY